MKKIRLIIFTLCIFMFSNYVYASNVSVRVSSNSVTKGSTVTVTATINADSGIYTTEGTLSCSGAGVSNSADMRFDDMNTASTSKSFTLTIKPTTTGTVTCTASGVMLRELAKESNYSLGSSSASITVKEPVVVKNPTKEYSSNNNLKNLTVDGYNLDPVFNKETLEYEIEVPNNIEKININATSEDSNAKISGVGEIAVNEGANKIEIKVEAENGNIKTYILNVTVKDLNPIIVKLDNKEYTIIKKEGVLEPPTNYEKSTVKIEDQEILCYVNDKTKTILVGLKDNEGNSNYYIYDEKTKKYIKYNNISVGGLPLNIISMPKDKLPSGYSKVSFSYEDNKLEGYQIIDKNYTYAADDNIKGSDFYLFYAINELTGKKGLYVYDKLEGTVQRYNNSLILSYQKKADNYFLYFLLAIITLSITIITFSIILFKKKKNKKRFA